MAQDGAAWREYSQWIGAEVLPVHLVASGWIAALGILAFLPVDFVFYPALWKPFWLLRFACAAVVVALGYATPRSHGEAGLFAIIAVTGGTLLTVIAATGGATSPYYSGLMLLLAATPVVAPLTWLQTLSVSALLVVGFALLPVLHAQPDDLRTFGLHLVFLALTTGVSSAAAHALDGTRFQDFLRRREIEQARDELAQLDELKTRFSANVHHELRTPLTLMLAPLDGLLAGDYGEVGDVVGRTLRTMHTNGQRLLKLINNLLDLAKLESQQFEIRRAPLDVGALAAGIVDGAGAMAERKRIRLRGEGLAGLPEVCADRDAIEKVVVNLLGNALKFTEAGGEVVVGARAGEEGVALFVRDTGAGLAPDQLERIFDRFAQADGTASRRHEGTGIGLSLAQELVQLHGGRIWAESAGLGHGATMHVALPWGEADGEEAEAVVATGAAGEVGIAASRDAVEEELAADARKPADVRFVDIERSVSRFEQHAQPAAGPDGAGHAPDDERSEILVVDDNEDMRELVSFILGREFRVRTARNGREALEALEHFVPDLVVSDIMMPEVTGTELCRAVKADPRLAGVPVMLVSSKAESEMKIEGLELGADDYVTKPFHPRELLARARSHAALRRTRRELEQRNTDLERALRELRLAEAHLVQAERLAAVGELAAGIAHEVNNPVNYALNAVRAMAGLVDELCGIAASAARLDWNDADALARDGLALRHRIDDAEVERLAADLGELAKIVSDGLDRTHRLVVDLRDFAAPGSGGAFQRVDARECVRATAQLVRHDLERRGVVLALALPEAPAHVDGDPGALNQVLLNLVKNAAEAFAGAPGSIAIEVGAADGEVWIGVRDDGPGIEPAVQERLFEPFFTTKKAGSGTGLGLSMCRRIADAHGGSLEVDSAPGGGSCFTLRLPAMTERGEGSDAT